LFVAIFDGYVYILVECKALCYKEEAVVFTNSH